MNAAVENHRVESYFAELDSKMADLPEAPRREFLLELRAHVMDRLEQLATVSDDDCRTVLKALGTPDDIGVQGTCQAAVTADQDHSDVLHGTALQQGRNALVLRA